MLVGVNYAARSTFSLTNQSATAFRIDAPPVIDGRLDESLWLTALRHNFIAVPTPVAHRHIAQKFGLPTTAKTVCGRSDVFPALTRFCSNWCARPGGKFRRIWHLVQPLQRRHQLVGFNHTSVALNDFIMNAQGSDDAWNGVWEVKSQIHEGGWSTEIQMPWSSFGCQAFRAAWNRFGA